MKNNTLFLVLLAVVSFFTCCTKDNAVSETIANIPNIKEYRKLSDAIDNINVKSKIPADEQMIFYLDKKYHENYRKGFEKRKTEMKNDLSAKSVSENNLVNLDDELNGAGFTYIQKAFIKKTTNLYPLDVEGNNNFSDDKYIIVENIKKGLLNIRNEVLEDTRLNSIEKDQLYNYIDVQYITLGSIFNYVERTVDNQKQLNGKWKISFKKIINIVISVIITTAVALIVAAVITLGNPEGTVLGGIIGFGSSLVSAANNRCIKFCGTGYCDTSFDDCYTGRLETAFVIKPN